ncbi:MAG: HAMP domain-containing sensor histidine kinase [Oscillospiraceae bacterium]
MNKITKHLTATARLTLYYALSLSLLLVILSGATVLVVRFYQNDAAKKEIESVETEIARLIYINEAKNLSSAMKYEDGIYLNAEKNGEPFYTSEGFHFELDPSLAPDRFHSLEDDNDADYLLMSTEFKNGDDIYSIVLVNDMQSEKRFLLILFFVMLAIDVAGLIISVLMGALMAKQVLKPIKTLTEATKQISSENLSGRIKSPVAKDEIYRLTKAINEMYERLEQAFDKQKQFISDASHELRTPLASIKGYASLISRWGKDDRAALEKSVDSIQEETEYMSILIDKLLFLARMDKRVAQLSDCSLSALVTEEAENLKVYAEGFNIVCDCKNGVSAKTDKALVQQLMRILTDNATKFTPAGGTITLGCKRENGSAVIWVADTGSGISHANQSKIFDRFFTENTSRNKDISGNGLGLSIAKSICDVLGASIVLQSEPEQGAKFNVIFR